MKKKIKRPQTKEQQRFEREKRKARYGKHWDEIRQYVYQRDNFMCRACGKGIPEVKKLNAHHILLLRVSQTNDIRNLITLCDECHKIIETKALNLLKGGGHRFDVFRMTHRYLYECRLKRQQALLEELKKKSGEPKPATELDYKPSDDLVVEGPGDTATVVAGAGGTTGATAAGAGVTVTVAEGEAGTDTATGATTAGATATTGATGAG
jgi:hypothetical protein